MWGKQTIGQWKGMPYHVLFVKMALSNSHSLTAGFRAAVSTLSPLYLAICFRCEWSERLVETWVTTTTHILGTCQPLMDWLHQQGISRRRRQWWRRFGFVCQALCQQGHAYLNCLSSTLTHSKAIWVTTVFMWIVMALSLPHTLLAICFQLERLVESWDLESWEMEQCCVIPRLQYHLSGLHWMQSFLNVKPNS